jgi:hypothetical protein
MRRWTGWSRVYAAFADAKTIIDLGTFDDVSGKLRSIYRRATRAAHACAEFMVKREEGIVATPDSLSNDMYNSPSVSLN